MVYNNTNIVIVDKPWGATKNFLRYNRCANAPTKRLPCTYQYEVLLGFKKRGTTLG